MAILFYSMSDGPDTWRRSMNEYLPELEFRAWPGEIGNPEEIEYAVVWRPEPGSLKPYPNLKAIFNLGAGVDYLFAEADLPKGVPVVRLVDRALTQGMTEYVIYWVIHFHREYHKIRDLQNRHRWEQIRYSEPSHRRVGILGLGELGGDAARKLVALGYDVAGWSRGPKSIDGVESFHGDDALIPFLARTEILVCLLPLTPATEGIMDKRLLCALPKGAFLINPGRGGHLVEEDMIEVLDSGHIAAAALDVFRTEPLPADHPFWDHPGITVTPHIASLTMHDSASLEVAGNIRRMRYGQQPHNVVDPEEGY